MGRRRRKRRIFQNVPPDQTQTQTPTPDWVININSGWSQGIGYDSGKSWTIYRVPTNLCDVHRSSYIPKIISIGPFHYGEPSLHVMEEHKMRFLFRLLGFTAIENVGQNGPLQREQDTLLRSLAKDMKSLEKKTRECYSETFDDIESGDFVQMMVVDGCFVIQLLRLYHKFKHESQVAVDDPIFTTRWMLRTLQRDLLMLQNQLPFFVLQKLFEKTMCMGREPSLIELTLEFFHPLMPRKKTVSLDHAVEYDHLLDIFHTSFLTSVQYRQNIPDWRDPTAKGRQLVHCVSELQEAGLKFAKRKDSDLLDIIFRNGQLKIPTLYINDDTVPVFLNFLAYEQCDRKEESYFTNYFMFFDSLVSSSDDVRSLHRFGIINHALGSEENVAHLLSRVMREIVYDVDVCHLAKQIKGVNDYYKAYYATEWHLWRTKLIRDYFSSPWTFLSLLAALVLLVLTITQTVIAGFEYFR